MAKVGILAFSDGRDAVRRDIEEFYRNVVVCGFGGMA